MFARLQNVPLHVVISHTDPSILASGQATLRWSMAGTLTRPPGVLHDTSLLLSGFFLMHKECISLRYYGPLPYSTDVDTNPAGASSNMAQHSSFGSSHQSYERHERGRCRSLV